MTRRKATADSPERINAEIFVRPPREEHPIQTEDEARAFIKRLNNYQDPKQIRKRAFDFLNAMEERALKVFRRYNFEPAGYYAADENSELGFASALRLKVIEARNYVQAHEKDATAFLFGADVARFAEALRTNYELGSTIARGRQAKIRTDKGIKAAAAERRKLGEPMREAARVLMARKPHLTLNRCATEIADGRDISTIREILQPLWPKGSDGVARFDPGGS